MVYRPDRPVKRPMGVQHGHCDGQLIDALHREALVLSTLRIEEVSDSAPLLLVNDVAPQLEGGKWTENAGLIPISSTNIRWLYEPKESLRLFRFTISEPDGRSYVLYQGAQYSPSSKEALRGMVR